MIEALFAEDRARFVASSRMAGYLALDALVGNTDRHHENWGIVLAAQTDKTGKVTLVGEMAPTFDHASSLGRELLDEARERRLAEGTIERYIRKARGGIFREPTDRHGMSPLVAAEMLAELHPDFFKPWQARIGEIEDGFVESLLGETAMDRAARLKPGEKLRVMVELNNPATRLAVPLMTEDYQMIGWAPRYLVEDLISSVPNAPELKAEVARVNLEGAPVNKRILIDYTGRVPESHQPMSTPDFRPLLD